MCYMNCIYEDWEGECNNSKMMGTSMAKCCIEESDEEISEEIFEEYREEEINVD